MVYDRQNEDEEHQKRRNQEQRNFRLGMGVSHISEETWEELHCKIDSVFENEQQQQEIEETETETIQEPEKKIAVLSVDETLIKDAIKEGSERTNTIIANKKIRLLNAIETEFTQKMEELDAQIAEVETERKRLQTLYEEHSKQLNADRLSEREIYRKTLSTFHDSIASILNNFSDSQTEKSLILLFNRQNSTISLKSVQSTKAILTKDEIKISGGD